MDGKNIAIEKITQYLKNKIESVCDFNTTKKVFIGPSMGGFGAFLYGSLLGANTCWGTSITNTLMHPGSTSAKFLRDPKFKISLNYFLNKQTKYHLLVGDQNIFDLYSASLFPDYVDVSILGNSGHVVPQELSNRGVSIKTVVDLLLKGFQLKDNRLKVTFHDIKEDIFTYFMIYQKNPLALERLQNSKKLYKKDFVLFNIIEARGLYKLGEKNRALKIIEDVILNSESSLDWSTYHFIGLVYRDLNQYSKALHFIKISMKLNPTSKGNLDQILLLQSKIN